MLQSCIEIIIIHRAGKRACVEAKVRLLLWSEIGKEWIMMFDPSNCCIFCLGDLQVFPRQEPQETNAERVGEIEPRKRDGGQTHMMKVEKGRNTVCYKLLTKTSNSNKLLFDVAQVASSGLFGCKESESCQSEPEL